MTAICIAALLSVYIVTGRLTLNPTYFSIPSNQINLATVDARLLYSDSAEVLDIVVCFFHFQDTIESPFFTKKSVTDFLE